MHNRRNEMRHLIVMAPALILFAFAACDGGEQPCVDGTVQCDGDATYLLCTDGEWGESTDCLGTDTCMYMESMDMDMCMTM